MYLDFVSLSISIQGCLFIFLGIKILDIIINKCIKKNKNEKKKCTNQLRFVNKRFKRYRRQCGSTIHVCNNEENKLIVLKSKKKSTAAQYCQLIEKNIISRETNYICMECFNDGITKKKNETKTK